MGVGERSTVYIIIAMKRKYDDSVLSDGLKGAFVSTALASLPSAWCVLICQTLRHILRVASTAFAKRHGLKWAGSAAASFGAAKEMRFT